MVAPTPLKQFRWMALRPFDDPQSPDVLMVAVWSRTAVAAKAAARRVGLKPPKQLAAGGDDDLPCEEDVVWVREPGGEFRRLG